MADIHETNVPEEILKNPVYAILARLEEDANTLYSVSEVDREVLHRLVKGGAKLGPEDGEKLRDALRSMETVAEYAAAARHAIEEVRKNPHGGRAGQG